MLSIRRILFLFIFLKFIFGQAQADSDWFVTEWDTTIQNPYTGGSLLQTPAQFHTFNNRQIAYIGVNPIGNYTIQYKLSSNPSASWVTLPSYSIRNRYYNGYNLIILTLPSPGKYKVRIYGSKFYEFGFFAEDRAEFSETTGFLDYVYLCGSSYKLLKVEQWGTTQWRYDNSGDPIPLRFTSANNMDVIATDTPNFSRLKTLSSLFSGCTSLVGNSTINQWNTSNITDMSFAFNATNKFNQPIGNWNTSKVTDMRAMFQYARKFNQPIGSWNTSRVTNIGRMFNGAFEFNQPIGSWNTDKITDMSVIFQNAHEFNQPIGNWNTSQITDMSWVFNGAHKFNQPIGNWDTSKVTSMQGIFQNAHEFNQPIGNWKTIRVTTMERMFSGAHKFNQPIGSWNTSLVTDMMLMFQKAYEFNQPIGSWDTKRVTNMIGMFSEAYKFNQPIGGWKTERVTNMMAMFQEAYEFNQLIGSWNTSLVTNMANMFLKAYNFNQDISAWNINKVTDMTYMLALSNLSSYNFSKIMKAWANKSFRVSPNTNWGDLGMRYATSAIEPNTIAKLNNRGLAISAQPQESKTKGIIYYERNNWNYGRTLVGVKENGAFEWLADYTPYDGIVGEPTQLLVFKRSGNNLEGDIVVRTNSHIDGTEHIYKLQNEVSEQQGIRPATDIINGREHKPGIIVYDPTNGHFYEATTTRWVRIDN